MFLTNNPFSDHGPSKKVLSEAFKYHIPEDIPANERTAFHGAAAAAAKAGKKNFNFGGKTHPVTMKKDTAKAIPTEAVKYPHMMYDPKTGKEVTAKTPMDHAKFSKMGYTHEKPKMNEISKRLAGKYISKASRDAYFKGRDQGTVDAVSAVGGSHPGQDYKKSPERKAAMRMRGIDRATVRLARNEGTVNESFSYHNDMAKAHKSHAMRHHSEYHHGKHNSDNEDMHGRAIDIHKQAHAAHIQARDLTQYDPKGKYKKAAKDAHEYSKTAIGTTKDAGKFKTGKPKHSFPKLVSHTKLTKLNIKSESTMSIREKLMSLYEGDRAAHYKSAAAPEPMHMKSMSSKGAMDMLNTPKSTEADGMKAAKDTADSIKKSAPGKKLRKADKNTGDLAIKPSATPVKDPAAKMQTAESVDYHKKMATVHNDHGGAHERESTNGGSSDHDFASDHHHEAAKMHKAAADAHKKHGGDSKQYKSAAAAAHKATGEAHETAKDAGKIKNVAPSMMKFPKKPSMKKEDYGISGNKVADSLLDAINQVTKEGSIKGSGTDRKAVLKKAFRAGEKQDQSAFTGKKPAIRAPKGMKGRMKSGKMDAFSAKHKDKGIEKAYQAGFHGDYSGNKPEKGKARMKPQSNFPLNKDQMKARKMMRGK